MLDTALGCTSCRGLPGASVAACSKTLLTGLLLRLTSSAGGPMEPAACWSMMLRSSSESATDSATVDGARTLFVFFESVSRGSSWHRCPMLRLMHLVQGLAWNSPNARLGLIFVRHPGHRSVKPVHLHKSKRGDGTYEIARHVLEPVPISTWLARPTNNSCGQGRRMRNRVSLAAGPPPSVAVWGMCRGNRGGAA